MRVNIVSRYNSIAMHRLTNPLLQIPYDEVVVSDKIDPKADLNYHVPFHSIDYDYEGLQVILYTHTNQGMEEETVKACLKADLVMCMSFEGYRELVKLGISKDKLWVAYCGNDGFNTYRKNIGIVGNVQPTMRKRPYMLLDIFNELSDTAKHFVNFVIIGKGWDPHVEALEKNGASVLYVEDITDEALNHYYSSLALLLVTSHIEGGPLPLLEAMKAGVPVLSTRVGYASDLLDSRELFDTAQEAAEMIGSRFERDIENATLAGLFSWREWIMDHTTAFGRLLGEFPETDPYGVARYAQLLDEIAKCKPKTICEIGTWSGHRATQMILEAMKHSDNVGYLGYDLFEHMTKADFIKEVSKTAYPKLVVERRIKATRAPSIKLVPGYTQDTLLDHGHNTDFYFIDGGHSEETILNDWNCVSHKMRKDTVFIFDDYYYGDKPEGAGCNTLVDGLDREIWSVELLPAITQGREVDGGLEIGMVKVTYA